MRTCACAPLPACVPLSTNVCTVCDCYNSPSLEHKRFHYYINHNMFHFLKKLISEDCLVVDDFCTGFEGLPPSLLLAAAMDTVAAAAVSVFSSLLASVDTSS